MESLAGNGSIEPCVGRRTCECIAKRAESIYRCVHELVASNAKVVKIVVVSHSLSVAPRPVHSNQHVTAYFQEKTR